MPDDTTPSTLPDHAEAVARPPLVWLAMILVGYTNDRWLAPLPFLPDGFPAVWVGVLVWLAGFALAVIALLQFRRAGTDVRVETPTATIVDTGIFAYSRNPIYLGAHIGIAGASIALNNLRVPAMLVPFYAIIRYGVIAREEAYLMRKFGEPFRAYTTRVRRWL